MSMRSLFAMGCCLVLSACSGGGGGGSEDAAQPAATYSLSGQVSAPLYAVLDADTPVGGALVPANNSVEHAQALPNPFVVGGFVSPAVVTDHNGQTFPEDPLDIYRVYLHAGDEVHLYATDTADPLADLPGMRLSLYPEGDAASEKTAPQAAPYKVAADVAGYYIVRVELATGQNAAAYVLSLGGTGTSSTTLTGRTFMPGEALVQFENESAARALGSLGEVVHGDSRFGYLVRSPVAVSRTLTDASDKQAQVRTLAWIQALKARADVRWAEPNYIRRAQLVPDDPFYPLQWALKDTLNMEGAWERLPDPGQGTVVAIIDSGIVRSHPDLAGQLVPDSDMYDFVSSGSLDLDDQPGRDANPDDPGDRVIHTEKGDQSSFHGTLVAGVIAALSGNGQYGASIAWAARIMPLRVLGKNGEGTDADIIEAIKFAAGLPNASGRVPTTPADVINLSLGQEADSAALRNAIDTVAALPQAPIMVAAAGNEPSGIPFYPAAYENVISVSAVTRDGTLASYSNFGTTIDVAAPGGDSTDGILTTGAVEDLDNGGAIITGAFLATGTSLAAPHVSAIASMMRAKLGPTLGPAEFKGILADISRQSGDPLKYGAGIIDGEKAAIKAMDTSMALLTTDVAALTLENPGDQATLVLSRLGTGALTVDSVTAATDAGGDWLRVAPVNIDGDGYGTYTVSVSAEAALEQDVAYSGTVTATSVNNSVTIPVQYMERTASIDYAHVGSVRVELYDGQMRKLDERVVESGEGADMRFSFTELPSGQYVLIASADLDGDGIAEPGEAKAYYPTASSPQAISLRNDLSGIDLQLFYDTAPLSASTPSVPRRWSAEP